MACSAAGAYSTEWHGNAGTLGQFALHRLTYGAVRETFGIAAQLTVRCIAKVADAYKLDKKAQRTFAALGAVAFDERILSYNSTRSYAVALFRITQRVPEAALFACPWPRGHPGSGEPAAWYLPIFCVRFFRA